MTWTVGQKVAVCTSYVPSEGFARHTVEHVYKNGGCRLSNWSRWTANGRKHGEVSSSFRLRSVEEIEEWENREMVRNRVFHLRHKLDLLVKKTDDVVRLERALAVLNEAVQP